ncbi:MAG: DNA-binding response regulator [Lysobacteraceae bacterium]|nr:MAG: DNA-binding response regulator [Xanthomonadaceae bacterium]
MSAKLRVLVVDDEPAAREKLVMLLEAADGFDIVGDASDGMEALRQIAALKPDLVFLDIQMPELDGLAVAAALEPDQSPAIIFVTAFDEHALAAFELHAVDYLLKPFDANRLQKTLQRIDQVMSNPQRASVPQLLRYYRSHSDYPQRLAFRTDSGLRMVHCDDIEWLESSGNYLKVCLTEDAFITRLTLAAALSQLPPDRFVQIHRSHVVNIAAVQTIRSLGKGDYALTLNGDVELRMSRHYKAAFLALFQP